MADETGKPNKAAGGDPGVLASLSSTRPQRLSRRAREGTADAPATTPRKAGPAPRKAKAKPAGKPAAAARGKAGAASTRKAAAGTKARATATKAESAAAAAKPAKRATPARTAAKAPEPIPLASEKPRPKPVRAGHPTLAEPSGRAAVQRADEAPQQTGVDLVKTVVQAAGEVAQIGATVGGQILKRAVDRLPKKP